MKIFSCHHRQPEFTCNTEIFQTLVSNLPAPDDGAFQSDLGGLNIAGDNLYSELRHQFYVWKNLLDQYDYVGFEHYRRPFFIDPLPGDQLATQFPAVMRARQYLAGFNAVGLVRDRDGFAEYLAMRRALDPTAIARVKDWIAGHDLVVPRPHIEDIEAQWKGSFESDTCWEFLAEGVRRAGCFDPSYVMFQIEKCYFMNMYIMRADLFDAYLSFCFDVLAFCRSRLALRGRALGYFSERLFSFWLYQKRIEQPMLRVLELPFLMLRPDSETGEVTEARAALI